MKSNNSLSNLVSNKKTKRKKGRKITLKRKSNRNKVRIIKGYKKFKNNRGIKI